MGSEPISIFNIKKVENFSCLCCLAIKFIDSCSFSKNFNICALYFSSLSNSNRIFFGNLGLARNVDKNHVSDPVTTFRLYLLGAQASVF